MLGWFVIAMFSTLLISHISNILLKEAKLFIEQYQLKKRGGGAENQEQLIDYRQKLAKLRPGLFPGFEESLSRKEKLNKLRDLVKTKKWLKANNLPY